MAGSTVKFGNKDIEVTVTYHNNTQNAVITYADDAEKKTLGSDKQDGKFDHYGVDPIDEGLGTVVAENEDQAKEMMIN